MKHTKKICLFAGAVLVSAALICGCGANGDQVPGTSAPAATAADVKQPFAYTWEEYQAMSEAEKLEFQESFASAEAFDAWMEREQMPVKEYPWDADGAKQPQEYTWAEFEALSGEDQIGFQNVLGMEAFEAWMIQAQSQLVEYPWDADGAKQPEEYTWAEFEALSGEAQMAFQSELGTEVFEAWMYRAQSQVETEYPWDVPGATPPEEYTWDEFEALSGEDQMAFQRELGLEAFEDWLDRAAP